MELLPRLIPEWPKLAWVASFAEGSPGIEILHGPMVETADDWLVEAAWDGNFEAGDFDRTDLVFGTGIRCRGDQVFFVAPGTAMDRLWFYAIGGRWYVSNSLGALSARSDLSLAEEHLYVDGALSDVRTVWGTPTFVRSVPTSSGDVSFVWFSNLVFDGRRLREVEKPDCAPTFSCFRDYEAYLSAAAKRIGLNCAAGARRWCVTPLATVSSGYDSPAAAVIAKHAGCTKAVTIRQSTSFWRGSDSGKQIAEHLGMECGECQRTAKRYPHEVAFWAASGWCNLLNWTLFPFPEHVCLTFQGNYGDALWERRLLPKPFTIDIWDDLAMGEFRLHVGMLQCPVPFWGMRHAEQIEKITFSEEMEPWTLHRPYDRPIARRLVEEAGVLRGAFAVRKKNTSLEAPFRWPRSPDAHRSFQEYLRCHGRHFPSALTVAILRRAARLESLAYNNLFRKLRVRTRLRPWLRFADANLLFLWANDQLKADYQAGLRRSAKT